MADKKWTKEEIKSLLERNDKAVIRGLLAVYKLQTVDEQQAKVTNHTNGVGFTGADAEFLTSLVDNYNKYGKLTEKQMVILRKKIKKYAGQLAKVANKQIQIA